MRQADPLNEEGSQQLKETRDRSIKEEYKFFTYACHTECKTYILNKLFESATSKHLSLNVLFSSRTNK